MTNLKATEILFIFLIVAVTAAIAGIEVLVHSRNKSDTIVSESYIIETIEQASDSMYQVTCKDDSGKIHTFLGISAKVKRSEWRKQPTLLEVRTPPDYKYPEYTILLSLDYIVPFYE